MAKLKTTLEDHTKIDETKQFSSEYSGSSHKIHQTMMKVEDYCKLEKSTNMSAE